ncbi:cupin-like domain-containing protein [Aureococcus anophagefferens]|nr:cupin-like domain-containing protein [Aureococcus anophagefferens]
MRLVACVLIAHTAARPQVPDERSALHVACARHNASGIEALVAAGAASDAADASRSFHALLDGFQIRRASTTVSLRGPEGAGHRGAAPERRGTAGFSVTPAEVAGAAGWPSRRRRRRRAAPPPAGGTPRTPADDGDATCAEGGGWAIDADVPRTCDLDVVDAADLTPEAFVRDYASVSRPVLVRGAMPLRDRCAFLGRGARDVADGARNKSRCGATAYPWMTQQDACGVFSMDDLANGPAPVCANGVKPVCVAQAGAPEALIGEPVLRNLPEAFKGPKTAAPLPVLRDAFVFWRHVQLFAGGDDAGATVHFHDAAYNLLVFGTKKWYLAPPADNAVSAKPTRAWVDAGGPKFECDQGPGDLMLVPEGWAHATKNAGPAMGIGVLYLQADRLVAGEACNPPDKADEAARADSWRALLGEGVRPKPTKQTKMKGGLLGIADQADQRGRGAPFSVADLCGVHGYGATAGNAAAVAEPLRGTGDNNDVDLIYVANQKAGSTTFAKDLGRVLGADVDARCACLGDQCAAWDGRTCSRHRAKGPVAPARGDAVAFTFVHDPVHVFWAGVRQAVCNERRPEEKGRNSTFLRLPSDDRPSDAGVAALLDDMAAGRYLGEPLCGNQIFNPTSMCA